MNESGRAPRGRPDSRWQDELIEREIPAGASVLDLGCGEGRLLERLRADKGVRAQGVELDPEAVFGCVARGVPVLHSDLDEGLKGFPDGSFDYAVLEETLQTLHRPAAILKEMLRVGRHGIVSFPNFGYRRVRAALAEGGRMPVTEGLPYRWHDTPNIHLFTLQDFLDWAGDNRVGIVRGYALTDGAVHALSESDNLEAEEVLLVTQTLAEGGERGFSVLGGGGTCIEGTRSVSSCSHDSRPPDEAGGWGGTETHPIRPAAGRHELVPPPPRAEKPGGKRTGADPVETNLEGG